MFSPFEWMVAGRYLRARKAEGFVSVIAAFSFLGIMLGVATLIIVMSVMNGFRTELIGRILGLNGHINAYTVGSPLTDYDILALRLGEIPGVTGVYPTIESQSLLTGSGYASGVMVRGIRTEDFERKPILSESIKMGSLDLFHDNAAVIGVTLADRLHLKIGDKVTLISPKGKTSPFGNIPRSSQYTIVALFDVGMHEYNVGYVFIPLESAQVFYQMPGAVTSLEIMTENPQKLAGIKEKMVIVGKNQLTVSDWQDSNGSFYTALQVERNVMFLILTLIIIVAAFNIISSMIMLVKDKGRDIAIMRTMGATRGAMMRIFIMTGAAIGVVGTTVGAIVGILFAVNIESIRQWLQGLTGTELFSAEIYFLSKLPAEIEWHEVTLVVVMALVISILATLYPAARAARMDPVEALRYE